MLHRTEAIVLRTMDYGETSRIATVFTRAAGKCSLLARGARRPRSPLAATIQPMAYVQVIYFAKPGRQLHPVREASHILRFRRIPASLPRWQTGLQVLELTHLLTHEEAHPPLFNLLLRTLEALDASEGHITNLYPYYALHLARLSGFQPRVVREDVLAVGEAGGFFDPQQGAVSPHPLPQGLAASRRALRAWAILACAPLETVLRMALTPEVEAEVHQLLDRFLSYHFEAYRPLRTLQVAEQMAPYRPS